NDYKLTTILDFDRVLGLKFEESLKPIEIPAEVKALAEKRLQARKNENWTESDNLRKKINNLGFEIKDTKNGYTLKKKT
ncbi:MAG: cysteine--tRNA ligase, partial [Patescibacteria group bacterium]